jgi:hypothetical protein
MLYSVCVCVCLVVYVVSHVVRCLFCLCSCVFYVVCSVLPAVYCVLLCILCIACSVKYTFCVCVCVLSASCVQVPSQRLVYPNHCVPAQPPLPPPDGNRMEGVNVVYVHDFARVHHVPDLIKVCEYLMHVSFSPETAVAILQSTYLRPNMANKSMLDLRDQVVRYIVSNLCDIDLCQLLAINTAASVDILEGV